MKSNEKNAENVVNGFRELRRFCKEVSRLLLTADGLMQKAYWKPIPRTSVVGNCPGRIGLPQYWLPTDLSRFYKNHKLPHLVAYVAVLLDWPDDEPDDPVAEALVTAGCLDYGQGKKNVWKGEYWLCRSHYWTDDPKSDGTPSFPDPSQWDEIPKGILKITTFACSLDDIVSSDTLDAKLLQPLLAATS